MRARLARRRSRRRGPWSANRGAVLRGAIEATRAAVSEHPRWATFFLLAGVMFFTVGPLLRYCREHRYFAVRAIEISGVRRLDAARVRVWLGMVEGSSIWAASPSELEERLEAQPAIARAAVRRILPDRLQVVIREREPRAIVRRGAASFLVDRAGILIGPANLQAGDLPIITLGRTETARIAAPPAPPARAAESHPKGGAKLAPPAAQPPAHVEKRPPTDPNWAPETRQLRQAVTVARLLEEGRAGVPVSELAIVPGSTPSSPPELVAYSSDGRLTLELGWGDWTPKLAAVRRVIAHVTGRPEIAAAPPADSGGTLGHGSMPPSSVEHLAGTLDVHDPASVVARWANAGAI